MNRRMRMFCRHGMFYVEFGRGQKKSLKTRDRVKAQALYREIEKEWLRGRLLRLEDYKKATISELSDNFTGRAGVSPHTLKKDALSLKLLREVIGNIQLRTITKDRIKEFRRAVLQRGTLPITVNGYLRHIKAALNYAREEGYLEKLPKIEMEATKRLLPRWIPPDRIDAILKKAAETDPAFYRYIVFQLWTGARRREGHYIEWPRIDFKARTVRLIGKGQAERLVPLLPAVVRVLKPVKKDIGKVFIQYHPDTVSKKFHAIAKAAGFNYRLHDLRHSCATYLLKNKVPLEVVQKILGHTNISTTKIYAEVLDEVMQEEMKKLRFK